MRASVASVGGGAPQRVTWEVLRRLPGIDHAMGDLLPPVPLAVERTLPFLSAGTMAS
ncbi:MAG: hypothetical protein M3P53_10025 [Actinomycetota bacterium]|nr:hypothetical protein [Actinomycetota bacterium]